MSYIQKKDRNGDENGVVMWSTVELSNIHIIGFQMKERNKKKHKSD